MNKVTCSLLFLIALSASTLAQQGAEGLVADGAGYLGAFFKNKIDIRVAVVHFENKSELSDLAMQKIYQMLVSRLEGEKNIRVVDLLVNFANSRGEFNLSQAGDLDYLIDLKLIQNKSRTGLGLSVFSRLQDRIVTLKYFEKAISRGEMEFLNTQDFAFSELGFSKLLEFESKDNLMDIQSIPGGDGGQEQYFFYYPDEIMIYLAKETRLEKLSQFKLQWERPVYPVLHDEGKLLLFRSAQSLILTAGNNFSSYSQVLAFRDGRWQEVQKLDFVPFKYIMLNQNPYLVGARYAEGRNFFKDKVYFMPFSDPAEKAGAYEKKTYTAMALDFSTREGQLQAVHLIDRDYNYHFFTAEFEEKSPLPEKKGASLAVFGGEWLAVSDYTRGVDQLFFYDIRDGGQRPVYTAKISGEVQFISAGTWQNARGFWAGVRQRADGQERLLVQFWGKRDE
jgi:hypothetical protein